ncbi:MAG: L-rhamnose isomerase, partial [Clostridia bacterium]|nr:L-rhamnose isomerase [Clostridia bacterium]
MDGKRRAANERGLSLPKRSDRAKRASLLGYFDASINRISAWVTGFRNVQKALLFALLQPNNILKAMQDESNFTKLMVAQEELKTLPFGEVWNEYCRRCDKP